MSIATVSSFQSVSTDIRKAIMDTDFHGKSAPDRAKLVELAENLDADDMVGIRKLLRPCTFDAVIAVNEGVHTVKETAINEDLIRFLAGVQYHLNVEDGAYKPGGKYHRDLAAEQAEKAKRAAEARAKRAAEASAEARALKLVPAPADNQPTPEAKDTVPAVVTEAPAPVKPQAKLATPAKMPATKPKPATVAKKPFVPLPGFGAEWARMAKLVPTTTAPTESAYRPISTGRVNRRIRRLNDLLEKNPEFLELISKVVPAKDHDRLTTQVGRRANYVFLKEVSDLLDKANRALPKPEATPKAKRPKAAKPAPPAPVVDHPGRNKKAADKVLPRHGRNGSGVKHVMTSEQLAQSKKALADKKYPPSGDPNFTNAPIPKRGTAIPLPKQGGKKK